MNGLVVFPIFFNLNLNCATRSSWSELQSAPGLVFADYIDLLYLWLQKSIVNLISVLTNWWCSCVELSLVLLEFAMISAFSWQNSVSLCCASFCAPRPNLPVTPGISWLPTFAFQSSVMKRTSFLVLVLEGLVGLHRTIELHLLQHYWLGHRIGLCDTECFALEMNRGQSVIFFDCIQGLHFRLLLTLRATPFLLRDSCPP